MKDANGSPVLRKNWADKPYATLLGYRYATTTQVPITLGTSGKVTSSGELSEIYFGRWSDMVIGVGMDVSVSTTTERYWELDQVGIRVDVDWDAVLFRPEAFVVAKSVKPFPTS
jgi:HK97 family phage major capsid protein